MVGRRRTAVWLLAVALLLSGCTFHRSRFNAFVQTMDLSTIEIGRSTWLDVLRLLGPPGPSFEERVGREDLGFDFLKYSSTDLKRIDFDLAYWLQIPFSWSDQQQAMEIMIEFDDAGVVRAVHQTQDHTIWRPWQKEWKRPPSETSSREASGS